VRQKQPDESNSRKYKGGIIIIKVQVFVIYGLLMTSRCHLHILVHQVEEK
jgi:hypothetical protein